MRYVRFVLSGLLITLFLLVTSATFAQTVINVGDTVEGTIGDSDVEYSINLEAGQLIMVTITSINFDVYVSMIDTQLSEIAYDFGDSTDTPYLALLVPATGAYTIRVGSYGSGGTFTLSVQLGEIIPIAVNAPLDIQFDGAAQFFSFEASANDVVTILASSPNFLSIAMELFGPDGAVVADNDDLFFYNQLRRVVLPLTGLYSVKLSSFSISDLVETVTLSVATDTVLSLDSGVVTVTIEEGVVDFDVARLTATAGTTYVLTVTTDNPEKGARIDFVLGVDEYGFGVRGEFRIRNATAGSVEFTPTVDGAISFIVAEEGFFSLEERPTIITLSIATK